MTSNLPCRRGDEFGHAGEHFGFRLAVRAVADVGDQPRLGRTGESGGEEKQRQAGERDGCAKECQRGGTFDGCSAPSKWR